MKKHPVDRLDLSFDAVPNSSEKRFYKDSFKCEITNR